MAERRNRQEVPMTNETADDKAFNRETSRLLRREALRRAAAELNTTSPPGLEQALAAISRDVTEEAASRIAAAAKDAGRLP
jgi:hypothetical protein